MTIFDLLFLALLLASVVTGATIVLAWLRGRRPQALRIARRYACGAVIYVACAVVSSELMPWKFLERGDAVRSDDWQIRVTHADRTVTSGIATYDVTFRIVNAARRAAFRENGIEVRLVDDRHVEYPPRPDATAVPFDIFLQPEQTVETHRIFTVPASVQPKGVVVEKGSGVFSWLILGRDPFERTILRLD